ncbi:MAG: hypothetical protein DI582_04985 [Azospirillum brasilense]|nr:MAG: hypothetical protein DI582_04985 [Azospirillum brasilense]
MKFSILLISMLMALSACGIKRPLVKPSEIPAYEQKREEKLQQREQEMREFEQQQQQLRAPAAPEAMLRNMGAA